MQRLIWLMIALALAGPAVAAGEACDVYERRNVELARQIKEDLKAEARRNGLPERLMSLFDQLGDCPMCIDGDRQHPIWPVIAIDYVDNDHPKKPAALRNRKNILVPWSGDIEYLARQGMREGYVESYHILLETAPCKCCDADTQEEWDAWNNSEPRPQDSPTWHPELDLDTSLAYSEDDPENLGEDPPDLVEIPEDAREWDMVTWPPLVLPPPERPMTTLCTACRDQVRTHNDMTEKINHQARVIARLVRSREGTRSLMYQRLSKIRALSQKGGTPEVLAERARLWSEFEEFQGQFNRESKRIRELFDEWRALLAQLEPLKAAVRDCEARCAAKDAQPLPAVLPSPVTSTDALPGKTRIASQACPGCEQALEKRNALARQMNQLVDAMAGTAVTDESLAHWESLRQSLVSANETLQTCLGLCDDPGALSWFNDGNTVEGLTGYSGPLDIAQIVTDWCPDLRTSDLPPDYWIDYLKAQAKKQGVPDEILVIYDALPKCTPCLKRFMNGNTMPYFVYQLDRYPNEYEWTPWSLGKIGVPELVRMKRMAEVYVTLDIDACPCCSGKQDAASDSGARYPLAAGLNPAVTLDFTEPEKVRAVFYDRYNELKDFSPVPDESAPESFSPPAPEHTPMDPARVCEECRAIAESIAELEPVRSRILEQIAENDQLAGEFRAKLAALQEQYRSLYSEAFDHKFPRRSFYGLTIFGNRFGLSENVWPVQATGYQGGLQILREEMARIRERIDELETARAGLIRELSGYASKLDKLYDDLSYCVANRCDNQLLIASGRHHNYVTTACAPCRELVRRYNDWLRQQRAGEQTRAALESDLRANNPGFSAEEIQRAADRLEEERSRDQQVYKTERLQEIRACEKKHCSEPPAAKCQDGDVTVDENGLRFTGAPCKGVPRTTQQRSARLSMPGEPALHSTDRLLPGVRDAWGLDAINLYGDRGRGGAADARPVTVAVIDSGVDYRHVDLADTLWTNEDELADNGTDDDRNRYIDDGRGWNFVDDSPEVMDRHGHGTLVAGIIGATPDNAVGIAGVNRWARIMPLKVTDDMGEGDSLHVAAAMAYAVNNGARVINVSLGGAEYSPAERAAVEFASRKGVLVVVAAGNQGASADEFWPAGLPGVITVAATEPGGARAPYSNWGGSVDIAAPGTRILSLRAENTDPMALIDEDYTPGANVVGDDGLLYHASGTSFAAPYVTGVGSLLMSLDASLDAEQVRRMLLQNATDIETPGVDPLTGYGALNAGAALDANPEFFIEASITGVTLAPNGESVTVVGTAEADRFAGATIEMGQGEAPTQWEIVGQLERPQPSGPLASVPTTALAGATRWTLRVTVRHRNGAERIGLLPLALQ